MGAWIETRRYYQNDNNHTVAPCVGAWIETSHRRQVSDTDTVAPCVGAWIETDKCITGRFYTTGSLPAWERGLKLYVVLRVVALDQVAPCVGAWIETYILNRYVTQ